MGNFTSKVVKGKVILTRKNAANGAAPKTPPPVPAAPVEDKGIEVVTEETPDPKTRRRPKSDEVSDG